MLECIVNLSTGAGAQVDELVAECGPSLLDVHSDVHHGRSVWTLAGPGVISDVRRLVAAAVGAIDFRCHTGRHPCVGAVDVVPFVPLAGSTADEAAAQRDAFAEWAAGALGLACYLYGPERSLPELRRQIRAGAAPDVGPRSPAARSGSCTVGVRGPLVAYNLWLDGTSPALAKRLARELRSPLLRALGFDLGGRTQLSCNLVEPEKLGPGAVVDLVAAHARVTGTELVGLVPSSVLAAEPPLRWRALDLAPERTIEARMVARGLTGPARESAPRLTPDAGA